MSRATAGCSPKLLRWVGTAALAVVLPGLALAQARPAQAPASTLSATMPTTPLPGVAEGPGQIQPGAPDSFAVGDNDLLSIYVYRMPDLSQQVRVSGEGTIRMPLLQRPILARGRTAMQIEDAVGAELEREGMAVHPQVLVVVREVASRPVVVGGAVKYPLVAQAVRPISVMEALSRAGGVADDAGDTVLVTKPGEPERRYELSDLLTKPASQEPMLSGGEQVLVLPAKIIYVLGALAKPGAFPLHSGQPITLLAAISLAQGLSTTAPVDKKGAEIIRRRDTGGSEVIPVRLDRILDHRLPDPQLLAGDIVYVPEAGHIKLLDGVLQVAGQAAAIFIGYHF